MRQTDFWGGKEGFWDAESYDHFVRDDAELARIINYVLNNPVQAGLVKDWRDWKWSWRVRQAVSLSWFGSWPSFPTRPLSGHTDRLTACRTFDLISTHAGTIRSND